MMTDHQYTTLYDWTLLFTAKRPAATVVPHLVRKYARLDIVPETKVTARTARLFEQALTGYHEGQVWEEVALDSAAKLATHVDAARSFVPRLAELTIMGTMLLETNAIATCTDPAVLKRIFRVIDSTIRTASLMKHLQLRTQQEYDVAQGFAAPIAAFKANVGPLTRQLRRRIDDLENPTLSNFPE